MSKTKRRSLKIRMPREKRTVVTSSREFMSLVIDLQARARKKGKYISQAKATRIIARAFKERRIPLDDNFIWLG
jgi:hypothetical protein